MYDENDDSNAFMSGGGAPIFKFDHIGATVTGDVVGVRKVPVTDMETGEPRKWRNGDLQYQWVFTLQTALREFAEDDGLRRVFLKYKALQAVQDAVRAAKCTNPLGGKLQITHNATEPASKRGYSPTKLFTAKFKPGAPVADEWSAPSKGSDADVPF